MSPVQDGAPDVDPREVSLLEDSGVDGTGPPLQVSAPVMARAVPARRDFLGRLEDVVDRSRPAVVGLVMMAAVGVAVAFAWQSRIDTNRSELDEALANATADEVEPGIEPGRTVGEFESAGPIAEPRDVDVGTFEISGLLEALTSSSSTTTTEPTTTSTESTTTEPTTTTESTTTEPTTTTESTTTESTTTTTEPTTTTTEPTTTTTLPTNPVGQFKLVNVATGQCVSGQEDVFDQQVCGTDLNQTFSIESTGTDVRIVEIRTGLVLDVNGGSIEGGAQIIAWPWHGGGNQRWYLQPVGSAYQIVNVSSAKCVNARTSEVTGGQILVQRTCDQRNSQLWALS